MTKDLKQKIRKIKLVLLDVDGVLTDGGIYIDNRGNELKKFNVKDGSGISMAIHSGIQVGIITGRKSRIVKKRAKELRIKLLFQGVKKKHYILEKIINSLNINKDEIAYIGDDVIDLNIMKRVGLSITVMDGHKEVKKVADIILQHKGGDGAVREFMDILLKEKGLWEKGFQRYS